MKEENNNFLDLGIKKLNPSTLFFSNQLEKLFEHLQEQLFLEGASIFASRLIIVPSPAVEQWLRLRLAEHLGIATAIQPFFLTQAVYHLFKQRPIQRIEQILFLAEKISKGLLEDQVLFEPVKQYIGERPQRVMILAKKLAYLFQRYGQYGDFQIQHPWQQFLWEQHQRCFPPFNELLKRPALAKGKIHVFGLNHLPPLLFHFFERQQASFYFLSPCKEFWSDLYQEACCGDRPQPLLLSLGRVGGQLAKMVEESSIQTYEDYQEEALHPTQYSLLHLLPLQQDSSIEIHAASTKMREVQILSSLLQPYLASSVEPKDILIMAPDIKEYAPYLRAVFGSWVFLKEETNRDKDEEIQAIELLFSMEDHRWSATNVLKVLRHPLFKSHWNAKQCETIHKWVVETGIRWGLDGTHRKRVLGVETDHGTWKDGCCQLLEELGCGGTRIDFPDAELLGELMDILDVLPKALDCFYSSQYCLSQWARACLDLYEKFFDSGSGVLAQRLTPLLTQSNKHSYPFQVIRPLLEEVLSQSGTDNRMQDLQRICCDSLLPMRCLPAKIICLLGMNEGAFPRYDTDSLDGLQKSSELPPQVDFDRYLFLEALLNYRDKLLITYQGRDPLDGSELPPSPVLQLLLPHVSHCIHPLHGYDERYFLEQGLPSSSQDNYELCLAKQEEKPSCSVLFHIPKPFELPQQEIVVHVSDLLQCVRTPLRHFYEQISFAKRKKRTQEDPLSVSPLVLAKLRRLCLKMPQQQAIEVLQRQGEIPTGNLFEALKERISSQILEVPTQTYELQLGVKKTYEIEQDVFHMPAFTVCLKNKTIVHVVGRLEGVSSQSVILPDKADPVGAIKWWPVCLLSHSLGLGTSWTFSRDQKQKQAFFQDAMPALTTLLHYYFQSQSQASPLYPQIILPIIKGDQDRAFQTLEETLDPALQWALQTQQIGRNLPTWQHTACELYQEMIHAWF
ncbi:MAG: exodeoxyribonuclease V subunit gamma [Verrucomicrobia bacterium]|nr:exodeoxyribonuclease V subunit gamma [Verrucomicrobiota bacterium]MBS0646161.1 exodeoxyribonuclease V subunit gamma [Verrucomicrobiota bacterium]